MGHLAECDRDFMEAAPYRDRMEAILNGDPVDVVPWSADLQWWRAGLDAQGTLHPRYRGVEGLLRLHQEQHTGIYLDGLYMVAENPGPRCSVDVELRGSDVRIETIHTPEGDLRTVSRRATDSWAIVEHPVQQVSDLRAVRAYYEDVVYTPKDEDYLWRQSLYGGWGMSMPLVQRTPLMDMVIRWCGIQSFVYLDMEHQDEVLATMDAVSTAQDRLYELLAQCPSPYLEIGDNISGEVVGGYFRRYGAPYYAKRVAQLHAAGKKVGSHIDGTLRPVLRAAAATGLDFVEGITPAPVGDLTADQIASELDGLDTIVWGGVPAALFAAPDWSTVRAYVEDVVRTLWRGGKLVLGVGDQVPPNGHISYCHRISDLMEELGPLGAW